MIWGLKPFQPLILTATSNGGSHLKSSVTAVLFPPKIQGRLQSLGCHAPYLSRCTAADIDGSARAAPSLAPAVLCWIWWSGLSE